ncbi:MAG TPA: hypothetical protein PLO55_10990, partial [Thermotogota bacterium]|nr:hypothetical protein [Thermotogota bacterium]
MERRFLERRHLCRHGFCYSIQKTLSTGDTKEDSMHLFWSAMERLLWNAVFWSADIYVGMGFATRYK